MIRSRSELFTFFRFQTDSLPQVISFGMVLVYLFLTSSLLANAAPLITGLSPAKAPIGAAVTINGSGFGSTQGGSTITINNSPVPSYYIYSGSWSSTSVAFTIPPGTASGGVVVTVGGVKSNSISLTIVPAPNITALSPTSGPVGTSITITGTNFSPSAVGGTDVGFFPTGGFPGGMGGGCGGVGATNVTNTSLVVTVPDWATTGSINVCYDGAFSKPASFTVTGTLAPVVNPGPFQIVDAGSTVQLDGTSSYDLNVLPLTYQWSTGASPDGLDVVFSDSTSPRPTFVAALQGEYDPCLVVSNGYLSNVDDNGFNCTQIFVDNIGVVPMMDAGPDQTVKIGATVQLDASRSSDPCGQYCEVISSPYVWFLTLPSPSGASAAALSNQTTVNPTFVADVAGTTSPG